MEEETKELEIPAELEGVSPEIAAEIMKEAETQESTEEAATPEENDAAQEEPQEDEKSAPENSDDGSKEKTETKTEEESKQPGAIPFPRFSEVNERMKAAEAKVAAYEAAKQQQIPMTTAPSPQEEQFEQALGIDRKHLLQSAVKIAKHKAMQALGIKEEELDYADPDKKRAFESAYQMEFTQMANQMDYAITARKREYTAAVQAQSAANEEYNKLVDKFQTDGDFIDVFNYAETEYIKKLSPLDQRALQVAFARTEAKQGSLQDVIIVRDHFTRAQQEYRDKQKSPVTQPPAQQTGQTKKIKQMQAHPRTDQLTGDSGDGGNKELTQSDIEKMLMDPNITIDQIPESWRKKLLV